MSMLQYEPHGQPSSVSLAAERQGISAGLTPSVMLRRTVGSIAWHSLVVFATVVFATKDVGCRTHAPRRLQAMLGPQSLSAKQSHRQEPPAQRLPDGQSLCCS